MDATGLRQRSCVARERRAGYGAAPSPQPAGSLGSAVAALRAAAAALAVVDVRDAGDDELADALAALVEHEAVVAEAQARVLRRFDVREVFRRDACVSTGGWLRLRTSLGHAGVKRRLARARLLARMPLLAAVLADGQVSTDHVDAVAMRATPARLDRIGEHEETLTRLACDAEPRDVAVAVQRIVDHVDPDGSQDPPQCQAEDLRDVALRPGVHGVSNLAATTTPLLAELLIRARDLYATPDPSDAPVQQRRTPGQRWHDALVAALTVAIDHHPGAAVDGVKTHAVVFCDLLSLLGADELATLLPRLGSGAALDGDTLRHLLATTNPTLRMVLTLGPWLPVSVGRAQRRLPASLRGAMQAVHRHCRAPGCDRPVAWCDADHNTEWWQGGATSLANTTPNCPAHNRLKHIDGWNVTFDPTTGIVTWTSADGSRTITLPPPDP